jgi:hypothetical protein
LLTHVKAQWIRRSNHTESEVVNILVGYASPQLIVIQSEHCSGKPNWGSPPVGLEA